MEYESYVMVHEDHRSMLGLALRDETSKIRKITVAPHESGDVIYLFYDKKKELVEQESERLSALRSIAFEITKNAVYGKLTNAKQRSIYLCEFCHISKSDAEDVMELVKIIEAEAEVIAELKEEQKRLVAEAALKEATKAKAERIRTKGDVLAKEREALKLTERQKAIDRERKANEQKHKKEMSK